MRYLRQGVPWLLAGVVLGGALAGPLRAQPTGLTGVRLNSVGLSVGNLDEMFAFYTKTVGLREAFTLRDKDGKPTMSFLHVSGDTFVQLVPANSNRPVGLSSVILQVDDVRAVASRLRAAGVDVPEPRVSPNTQSTLTSFRDPAGFRVELIEMPQGSRIRDAMDRWKEGR